MSYLFEQDLSLEENTRRVACEQIDDGISHIDERDLTDGETVHDLRKRCKKLRALLRLVRSDLDEVFVFENAWYRDTSLELSQIRDAEVTIEAFDLLIPETERQDLPKFFCAIHQILLDRRDSILGERGRIESRLEFVRDRFTDGRNRIDEWTIERDDFSLLREGLERTYRRGRKAMDRAYSRPTDENFHEWRKRVKDHWYHVRLLESSWTHMMTAYTEEIYRLSQYLGDDHDLGLLRKWMMVDSGGLGSKEAIQFVLRRIEKKRTGLRDYARPLGEKIYAEKPTQLGRRFESYWEFAEKVVRNS